MRSSRLINLLSEIHSIDVQEEKQEKILNWIKLKYANELVQYKYLSSSEYTKYNKRLPVIIFSPDGKTMRYGQILRPLYDDRQNIIGYLIRFSDTLDVKSVYYSNEWIFVPINTDKITKKYNIIKDKN